MLTTPLTRWFTGVVRRRIAAIAPGWRMPGARSEASRPRRILNRPLRIDLGEGLASLELPLAALAHERVLVVPRPLGLRLAVRADDDPRPTRPCGRRVAVDCDVEAAHHVIRVRVQSGRHAL